MSLNHPVAASTSILCSEALCKIIKDNFYIQGLISCQFYLYGVSDTYKVSTENSTYFLRVYNRKRKVENIVSELNFVKYLFKGGCDVAVPVDTRV